MQFGRMGDRGGLDLRLTKPECTIGHFPNRDAKRGAIETGKRRHHGSHQCHSAMWTDERQRGSCPSLVFAENDGIKEKRNKVREVVGVKMREQNVRDGVAIDPALDQVGECARTEIQQKGLIRLDEIPGCGARGVNIRSGPQDRNPDHVPAFSWKLR